MTDTTNLFVTNLTLNGPRKPDHVVKFRNQVGDVVGTLDFNGPAMTFVGNAQESAKMFFHVFVAEYLAERLNYERVTEREECAAVCDRFQARDVGMQPAECAAAIRARSEK